MDEGTGMQLLQGDCLSVMRTLPSESIHFAVTSPPYFQLRSYLPDDHPDKAQELGLEDTPEAYLERMVEVFRELRRVLRKDGTFACNVGDSYNAYNGNRGTKSKYAGERDLREPAFPSGHGLGCKSLKPKDLMMMPSRLAIAMQADGWWLRSMLPFVKRSAMPESATDRPSSAIEYVFIFSRSPRYYWDSTAVRRPHSGPVFTGKAGVNRTDWQPEEKDGLARSPVRMKNREYNPNGRNLRNSDFYFDSLDTAIEATRAELAHLLHLREKGGLLLDGEGEPLALDVNPQALADAHFASFPEKLVAPLIHAGTSEWGCCAECGAPWVRVLEKHDKPKTKPSGKPYLTGESKRPDGWKSTGLLQDTITVNTTTGWQASCKCGTTAGQPCVVLDPFAGSGTTSLVASKLGRRSIAIELSEPYTAIFRRRNNQGSLLL